MNAGLQRYADPVDQTAVVKYVYVWIHGMDNLDANCCVKVGKVRSEFGDKTCA